MYRKNFGKFPRRKFKKITDKALKTVNNAFVWALFHNSTLKAKILTEMIVNQHIIIAYYI